MNFDWLMDLFNSAPTSLKEREKFLESQAQKTEELADAAEKEAQLRARIASAKGRIKAVAPRNKWLPLIVIAAFVLIMLLLFQMC